jgi:site-specific DNA-methyltransferase (adenine-specific)
MKDYTIDCVFADPPFNLGKEYRNGFSARDDLRLEDEYLDWCHAWIDECVRVLVEGGALFIYTLPKWAFLLATYLHSKDMVFRHWIALSMKGTYPRGNRLYPAHYALHYFSKGEVNTFNKLRLPVPVCRHCGKDIKDYGGHRKYLNPEGLNLTDFWDDTSPNRHKGWKSRPGVNELKPMIPARAIEMSTVQGHIVLDPFGGGGSTFQEAQRLDRWWIGSEIGDCEPIENRLRGFDPFSVGMAPPRELSTVFKSSACL